MGTIDKNSTTRAGCNTFQFVFVRNNAAGQSLVKSLDQHRDVYRKGILFLPLNHF